MSQTYFITSLANFELAEVMLEEIKCCGDNNAIRIAVSLLKQLDMVRSMDDLRLADPAPVCHLCGFHPSNCECTNVCCSDLITFTIMDAQFRSAINACLDFCYCTGFSQRLFVAKSRSERIRLATSLVLWRINALFLGVFNRVQNAIYPQFSLFHLLTGRQLKDLADTLGISEYYFDMMPASQCQVKGRGYIVRPKTYTFRHITFLGLYSACAREFDDSDLFGADLSVLLRELQASVVELAKKQDALTEKMEYLCGRSDFGFSCVVVNGELVTKSPVDATYEQRGAFARLQDSYYSNRYATRVVPERAATGKPPVKVKVSTDRGQVDVPSSSQPKNILGGLKVSQSGNTPAKENQQKLKTPIVGTKVSAKEDANFTVGTIAVKVDGNAAVKEPKSKKSKTKVPKEPCACGKLTHPSHTCVCGKSFCSSECISTHQDSCMKFKQSGKPKAKAPIKLESAVACVTCKNQTVKSMECAICTNHFPACNYTCLLQHKRLCELTSSVPKTPDLSWKCDGCNERKSPNSITERVLCCDKRFCGPIGTNCALEHETEVHRSPKIKWADEPKDSNMNFDVGPNVRFSSDVDVSIDRAIKRMNEERAIALQAIRDRQLEQLVREDEERERYIASLKEADVDGDLEFSSVPL